MEIEDDNQQARPLPPEYQHLESVLQATEGRLHQLDRELTQQNAGPQLNFDPPAYAALPPPLRRSAASIRHEKETLKADTYQQMERATADAPAALSNQVRDTALGRIYKEDIARLKAAERGLPAPDAGWGLEDKQIGLLAKLWEFRDRQRDGEKASPKDPERPVPAPHDPERDR